VALVVVLIVTLGAATEGDSEEHVGAPAGFYSCTQFLAVEVPSESGVRVRPDIQDVLYLLLGEKIQQAA
jgi:hypothetical protein